MDEAKIRAAVRLFLEGIGEDPEREGLLDTPDRVARMCDEIFGGLTKDASVPLSKTFASDDTEPVLVKDIGFYSVCEHHFLPFFGKAHIAYVPNGRVVGLSKLARTVEIFARRPQIQERMNGQIADAIMEELKPAGVLVVVEAEHMCMAMRGVEKTTSKTLTLQTRGCFKNNDVLVDRMLSRIGCLS